MMVSQKVAISPFLSFPRKRESSKFKEIWTPASAGVTIFRLFERSSSMRIISNHRTFSFIESKKALLVYNQLTLVGD
jgi:hypothetical protein